MHSQQNIKLQIFFTHWVIETNLINKFAAYEEHESHTAQSEDHWAVIYN
jgi:hypothetical protein